MRNLFRTVRPSNPFEIAPGIIIPMTDDGKCVFLGHDLRCAIYDERPFVCSKYGDETDLMMTCSWQTKDGLARPEKERKNIDSRQRAEQSKRLKTNI